MPDLELVEAVKDGNIERVRELIASSADVDQQDEQGWTPLNFAAGKGNTAIAKLLIEKGADVFKAGRDQRTPMMIALAAGHAETAEFLGEVENAISGGASARPARKYCKAFYLKHLKIFSGWPLGLEPRGDGEERKVEGQGDEDQGELHDESVVFIHQDFTVTRSMWHGEDVIFDRPTPDWMTFCTNDLKFKAPDDLDLIVPANAENLSHTLA
jgi:uncharacterized protein